MAEGERSTVLDRSTPDLIRRLIDDANGLVELQIRLAKLEAKENLLQVLGGGKWLGVAAGLGLLALITLVVFIITGLASLFQEVLQLRFFGAWFWSLVLLILFGGLAAFFGLRGIKQMKVSPLQRTRQSIQEDIEWLQQPMKRNGK
jgi:uncharacterized membrane protein YqjE